MEKYERAEGLGLCEHCETVVSISEYPGGDEMNAKWLCGKCKGELTHLSFGFDRRSLDAQKVRWVGPDGKWTDKKPTDDFQLGTVQVMVGPKVPNQLAHN